jgi:hypothetical protein
LPIVLAIGLLGRQSAAEDVIYAVPNGDYRLLLQDTAPERVRGPDGKPVPGRVVGLREALAMAWPGVTIQLLPGRYTQDTPQEGILFPRNGSPDYPITLRGMGTDTVIEGKLNAEKSIAARLMSAVWPRDVSEVVKLERPDFRDGSVCFRFEGKQWIVLDNLTLLNCADAAIQIINSQYIALRNSVVLTGLYAVYAEGPEPGGEGPPTHHLLIENNVWIQNPKEDMWRRNHWCEYKYGSLVSQRGALFAGVNVAGDVIIRGNVVRHAFNAVRMDVSKAAREDPFWRGKLNTNVQVYDNDFAFIRDNVLEPEYDATNWWFHGNRIRNAHAWFSFDGLYGGRWYVFDNLGWFDDKPSRECVASGRCGFWQKERPDLCGDLHDGGRVFKFRPDGRYAPGPLYVFNNSWYLRASVIKDGRLGYIGHWNNAIEFCRPEDHPDRLCDGVKPFFNGFIWDIDNYSFGHDLSNHPDFPVGLRAKGYRVSGLSVPHARSLFVDAPRGNLALADGSPGRGGGCIVSGDDSGFLTCENPRVHSDGPDVGAAIDGRPGWNVSFVHYDGGLYNESPRIVRVDPPEVSDGQKPQLRIVFSTPVVLMASDVRAELDYGDAALPLLSQPCHTFGRTLSCDVSAPLPLAPLRLVRLPDALVGVDGELVTEWGSVSDLVTLMR